MAGQPIVLVPHDPRWAAQIEAERAAILRACAGRVLDVHHIGSTAIPGIAAKPILDLLPVLRRLEDGPACAQPMRRLGHEYLAKNGIPGRHYFRRRGAEPRNVHMFPAGHPEIARHLRFRDHLRAHPDEARAHEALKRALAARFVEDVLAYAAAKNEFCARIDRLALAGA